MKFRYRAVDESGHSVESEIDAPSEDAALTLLLQRGLTPLEVKPFILTTGSSGGTAKKSISYEDLAALARELATMLESGVGLIDAFDTLAGQTHQSNMALPLQSIIQALQQGQTFSDALQASDLKFPPYVFILVKAGEATGEMSQCLNSAAEQMEFDLKLRNETREALIYPSVLVASGLIAIVFIFAFVVPRFSSLLQGRGVELPLLSQWVLKTGQLLNIYWLQLLIGTVVLMALIWPLLKNAAVLDQLRVFALRLPILGAWIVSGETARWTSMLSVLLAGRVPILTAVDMAATSVMLSRTQSLLQSISSEIRGGKPLSEAIDDRKLLNPSALTMLRVGEKSGAVTKMMRYIATNSADQHRTIQRRVISLMEPASIIVIGIALGTIMIGVVLAMTSLTEIKF